MTDAPAKQPRTRRDLLALIGTVAGSAAMYQAMTSLGHAQESSYRGPIRLEGDPRGATVLILGAGLAGMVAALELRQAGYRPKILEYDNRAGGRCFTIRGGDRVEELGGNVQTCTFDEGLYFNPGPWRIPHHHHAVMDYCRRLGVRLEPFVQINHAALLHSTQAFGGKPQPFREVQADYHGAVAELLAKATRAGALDQDVTREDREILLESLRNFGALDAQFRYVRGPASGSRRGWERRPGGGVNAAPIPSTPVAAKDILNSRLWAALTSGAALDFQTTMFEPVGGMDMIARAFAREVGEQTMTFGARVTTIRQDDRGVTVTYERGGQTQTETADWCVNTIPLSVLAQMDVQCSPAMGDAIASVPYAASIKVGLQMKRRFWETDHHIYGGISYTDLPNRMISYPSTGYLSPGKGVLLAAYAFGPFAFEYTALDPAERIRRTVEWAAQPLDRGFLRSPSSRPVSPLAPPATPCSRSTALAPFTGPPTTRARAARQRPSSRRSPSA
ncbi:flavin monoamine oxidase family protein [Leptolyngbya sp. 15MV]|nr:flavin monoamine oxidase family protein [Leptolyngbya sp. 15MV]